MRIEQLALSAFGRFHDRKVELYPGLNVVFGPNEAGKSTLQAFLLGMLYGFKRQTQRRDYRDDLGRFRPWEGNEYRGSLQYILEEGRGFRVERIFEPQREEVRIYDLATGSDLTETYPMDRRKERLYAEAQLGLSEEVFRSTAWVGQLEVSHLEMGRELVSRVANLQESGREDLSVRVALEQLAGQVAAIGSERAPTRPYGRLVKRMEQLAHEEERAHRAREQVLEWEARLTSVRGELATVEAALMERSSALREVDGASAAGLQTGEWQSQAGAEAAARVETLAHLLRADEERLSALSEEQTRLEAALTDLDQALAPLHAAGESGESVLAAIEQAERSLSALRLAASRHDTDRLKAAVTELDQKVHAPSGQIWLGVSAVSLLLAPAAFLVGDVINLPDWGEWVWALGCCLLAVLGFVFYLQARTEAGRACEQLTETRRTLNAADTEAEERADKIRALEREREKALATVGAVSAVSVRSQMLRHEQLVTRREGHEIRLRTVRDETAQLQASLRERQEALNGTLAVVMGRSRADVAALPDPIAEYRLMRESRLLRQRQQQEEWRSLEERRSDLRSEASDLAARVETALGDLSDTADLRRELAALTEERQAYDEELAALEMARRTIEAVSAQMHREFAPRLNEMMGSMVQRLTAGRYRAIRIDEEMNIRVITDSGRTVELDALSSGTVDQFYLGLRLALLDLVAEGKEPVPLLLDDPFVQYDEERTRSAMSFLSEISSRRQVILFTCHGRDASLAREIGDARVIELIDEAATAT